MPGVLQSMGRKELDSTSRLNNCIILPLDSSGFCKSILSREMRNQRSKGRNGGCWGRASPGKASKNRSGTNSLGSWFWLSEEWVLI